MRLPTKGKEYFSQRTTAAVSGVEVGFVNAVKVASIGSKKKVMGSDGKMIEVESFESENVTRLLQRLADKITDWESSGLQSSTDDDLRRTYRQFFKQVQEFRVSAYFGIQFHALPYYRVDDRIPEIQKQLAFLAEKALPLFGDMNVAGNKVIQNELNRKNIAGLGFEDLFTRMFDDEQLFTDLTKATEAVENDFKEFHAIKNERDKLLAELAGFVTYTYQMSPALLDYNKLLTGEEGMVTYFDVERIINNKTGKTKTNFNAEDVSRTEVDAICAELESVSNALETL